MTPDYKGRIEKVLRHSPTAWRMTKEYSIALFRVLPGSGMSAVRLLWQLRGRPSPTMWLHTVTNSNAKSLRTAGDLSIRARWALCNLNLGVS